MSCTQIWRVWNAVSRQVEQQELELENARAKADANTYQWTDEALAGLGFDEATIAKISSAASVSRVRQTTW